MRSLFIPLFCAIVLTYGCDDKPAGGEETLDQRNAAQTMPVIVPDTTSANMPVLPMDTSRTNMPVVTPK